MRRTWEYVLVRQEVGSNRHKGHQQRERYEFREDLAVQRQLNWPGQAASPAYGGFSSTAAAWATGWADMAPIVVDRCTTTTAWPSIRNTSHVTLHLVHRLLACCLLSLLTAARRVCGIQESPVAVAMDSFYPEAGFDPKSLANSIVVIASPPSSVGIC